MRNSGRRARGIALILSLAVLSLLAALAVAFAGLAGVERATSRAYLDGVRARLAAQSGVHAALALLRSRFEQGLLVGDSSWSVADPGAVRLDGDEVRDAAFLNADELYRVRIRDLQGALHVNDGLESPAVAANLRRLLDLLGARPAVRLPDLGRRILEKRPPGGWPSLEDLRHALELEPDDFERVRPFLTARAWRDPDVALPVPLSDAVLDAYPVRTAKAGPHPFRRGHGRNADGVPIRAPMRFHGPALADPAAYAVWGRDSLVPHAVEVVSRAPVNVNSASREILVVLLTDLQGFFLLERAPGPSGAVPGGRPCASPGGAYDWTQRRYAYEGAGEEAAFLFRTVPFTAPGGRERGGISAEAVADEIIACRESAPSPEIPGLDYGRAPFGGPFRSWSQFHRFVDALVEGGLVADPRAALFGPSELAIASRAAGDVLKANFNPNLHLNELNPDRALFLHVDKTDLLVNSTEFCFGPMGRFEIRSAGHVVDAARRTIARAEVRAVTRLFDARRLSVQRDFHAGVFGARGGGFETNNNRGVEGGPEPDNGPAPSEHLATGWIQLPTYGSTLVGDALKPPGELRTTMTDPDWYPGVATGTSGGSHLGSVIHAHLQYDHAAHYHASRNGSTRPPRWDGFRVPLGAWQTAFGRRSALALNHADPGEDLPSPYGPVEGARVGEPGRHRLVRSFRGEPPAGPSPAPSDLRLDGAYVERDSAFGWWIDENVSFNVDEGAAAFWVKPAFEPGCTSKRRTLLSLGRYHAHRPEVQNPSPFGLYVVPPAGDCPGGPPSYAAGRASFPPASLAFGFGFSSSTGYSWELDGGGPAPEESASAHAFAFTPSLNHEGHGCGRPSLLRAHEWTHVGVTWKLPRSRRGAADAVRVYVNGRLFPGSETLGHPFAQAGEPLRQGPAWTIHSLQATVPGKGGPGWVKNFLRLGGEPSVLVEGLRPGAFPGNYSADATFDEFYLWMDRSPRVAGGLWGIQELWRRGRYYRPDDADPDDARWVSTPLLAGEPPARPGEDLEVVGLAWTEWAEGYEGREARFFDRSEPSPRPLAPAGGTAADAGLLVGGRTLGPFRDPGFSPVREADGRPIRVGEGDVLQASLKLKAGTARNSSAVLLASPIVDDLTLYFRRGPEAFEEWVQP